jgi:tyrosinase
LVILLSVGIMGSILSLSIFAILFLLHQHTESFAINGISAGVNSITGERPARYDIKEFYMSGPAWDLFVLALREFQQVNQDDPLSYYQVAGKRFHRGRTINN